MSVCVPMQQRLALALRAADGTPSRKTLQPLPNATDHDKPSPDAEHAADDASEPQAGDYPIPVKFTTNKRRRGDDNESSSKEGKRLVSHCASGHADDSDAESTPSDPLSSASHDEHSSSASSATTDVADGRDGEPMNPNSDEGATSDFADDWDANSRSSLDSECLKYIHENGRRFHADFGNGYEYLMPNDEKQNEILDISHAGWLCFHENRLYSAPIGDVRNVLDVGTGTGIWAVEFADETPSANVIGTDISPIQPIWVPPNVEFQVDDCNLESTFRGEYFDFIHVRGMAGCISDCNSFAKRQFDDLKPGGYLEIRDQAMRFESDDESHKNHSFNEWRDFWEEVGSKLNQSLTIAEDGTMEEAMKRAGFTNVKAFQFKMPVGIWPKDKRLKETGRYNHIALDWDLEGFVLRAATQVVEWSYEEAIFFASRVRQDLRSLKPHLWRRATVIYGQKPK